MYGPPEVRAYGRGLSKVLKQAVCKVQKTCRKHTLSASFALVNTFVNRHGLGPRTAGRYLCSVRVFCRRQNLGAGRIHFARVFCSNRVKAAYGRRSPKRRTRWSVSFFLVRPAGFEPVAYRVGVIRRSTGKALGPSGFVGFGQIYGKLPKIPGGVAAQSLREFLR